MCFNVMIQIRCPFIRSFAIASKTSMVFLFDMYCYVLSKSTFKWKAFIADGTYVACYRLPSDLCGPYQGFCGLFRQFCVNTLLMHCVRSMSLIFRCYIVLGHCDIMCDITALHVHGSCDHLL